MRYSIQYGLACIGIVVVVIALFSGYGYWEHARTNLPVISRDVGVWMLDRIDQDPLVIDQTVVLPDPPLWAMWTTQVLFAPARWVVVQQGDVPRGMLASGDGGWGGINKLLMVVSGQDGVPLSGELGLAPAVVCHFHGARLVHVGYVDERVFSDDIVDRVNALCASAMSGELGLVLSEDSQI